MGDRRGRIAGIAAAVAAAALCAPAAALGAHSELLYTRKVGRDVTLYAYRYGPLVAAPGHNLILVGPVTIEKPAGDGYMVRYKPGLVGPNGKPPPVEQVHMHHAVFLNLSGRDRSDPTLPERIGGFAEEKTIAHLPRPYGYPVRASDVWGINYMLHNETAQAKTVWITYDIDWVPKASALGRKMIPAHPIWLDVQNGKAYPVFDVLRGSGRNGRLTYPDQVHPYGRGPHLNQWHADRDMTLVAAVGHLHPGGLWNDLKAVRGRRHAELFRSRAHYFDPGGPISWDMAMTYTPSNWRVAIRKGDRLDVSTTYETRRASWYESMGIVLVFAADGAHGPDPFRHRVARPGRITHGHLPEASNHGGRATGLPDPRKEPDGGTIDNGVAVDDFTYMPGDLTAGGTLGRPPVVTRGQSLQFGNFDASASILHTITACRVPCNRSTGVSYPIANGPVRFDSGQLGYGPPGLTAAAQRPNWRTPARLRPGTYTYFCRVHPFMRGAFRVRRAH